MAIRKIHKRGSFSKQLIKSWRKRRFNKKPSRSDTLDSLNSLDSRNSDLGLNGGGANVHIMNLDEGVERQNVDSREAQVIPFHHVDEWALFNLLEDKFGADKFKIEQNYEAFNIWAPEVLEEEDIESCRC